MIKDRYLRDVVASSGRCEITTDMITRADENRISAERELRDEMNEYLKKQGYNPSDPRLGPMGQAGGGSLLWGLLGNAGVGALMSTGGGRCPHCGNLT